MAAQLSSLAGAHRWISNSPPPSRSCRRAPARWPKPHMAPRAAEIDRTEAYPWDQVERLRRRRISRHDHSEGAGRARARLSRRGPGDRGDGQALRPVGADRGRDQYGRDRRHHRLRHHRAAEARRRARAVRRQAGHLHHRARGRQRRNADDDARRQARRRLRPERQEALDHGRRGVAAASRFCACLRRTRHRAGHRRVHRGARPQERRAQGPDRRQARAGHGPARHSRDRADLRQPRKSRRADELVQAECRRAESSAMASAS